MENIWLTQGNYKPRGIYLSCGSSDETGLLDRCIDFVVTDPPFFDNVHYSELADFFHAWQSLYPRGFISDIPSTRQAREVQDTNPNDFAAKLRAVFTECCRVLKDNGMLVFTYHHSRAEGWTALMEAVIGAGFSVVNAHPVKSEMSVAIPKSQTSEPIQLDIILICKKREQDTRIPLESLKALKKATERSIQKLTRLTSTGLKLSLNDCRIIIISQFMATLGPVASAATAIETLLRQQSKLEEIAESSLIRTETAVSSGTPVQPSEMQQMTFSFEFTASANE